jgi:formylglycine-generating enzyme required for sulfatase activity
MRSVLRCLCGLALLLALSTLAHAQPVRNPDAVAIIVGNRAYTDRDVPPVDFAHNDARAIERYVVDVLGFDRRNVVVVLDANRTALERALGNERGAGSEMRRLLRPDGTSDLFVYYSGHGMPSRDGSKAILLPVDVAPASAEIDGLPLDVVRRHLETLPARSVTLVIDACFSGQSHRGALERGVSVPYRAATLPPASPRVTELLATDAEQVASWDEERRHGLFTEHFLRAVYGEADKPEYGGRGDGAIRLGAVKRYLDREMTYAARPPAPAAPPPAQRGYPVGMGQSFRDCTECPEMVVIPPGSVGVGQNALTPVTLREPLAVGRFHVTVAEYRAFVAATGGRGNEDWQRPFGGQAQTDRDPVVNVSWEDAKAYVRWLSQRTGRGYRLLSEAEWEYAARAGTASPYFWGVDAGRTNANCDGCGSQWDRRLTSPVGSFGANAFGLHDMAGNAWQWVEDCHTTQFPSSPDATAAMTEGRCAARVLRGGSWTDNPRFLRSEARYWFSPETRYNFTGFRVGRGL